MLIAPDLILLAGLLLAMSILATVITPRLGVPLLLIFLIIGMLAGVDGPGGIPFSDYGLANLAGTVGLAVILFDGGLRTSAINFRTALWPSISLATVGVLLTAGITGAFAAWLLKLTWAEGLLIGAIVGSTDAAAVFALLGTRSMALNTRVSSTLETESGTNDPMAVFLTLAVIGYLSAPNDYTLVDSLIFLVQQMGIGSLMGLAGGVSLASALNRLDLNDSLYPLMALAGGLLIFGLTDRLGGSGFLAVYLAGLWVGNHRVHALPNIRRFHDGVAWLAQIGMFVLLGLLATPTELATVAVPGLLIALVLMLVARPVAVTLGLLPFRFPWREKVFVSWVGLRGSVPIVLATFPLIAGIDNAELFFNIAFIIVLVSLVVQGWTMAPAAQFLGLYVPNQSARTHRVDIDLPGARDHEIVSYRLPRHSALAGQTIREIELPDTIRIVAITRGNKLLSTRDWGRLREADSVALLCDRAELDALDKIFEASAKPLKKEEQRFFGEFGLRPDAPMDQLALIYGVSLSPHAARLTVAEFLDSSLPNPVIGDRLRFGDMELVIRELKDDTIGAVGLRLPKARAPAPPRP
ncbi:MAG: potassium/proton antiporter [Polycyclovorans sp.]|jgi:potassium/hydrogen antiporter|nr:potassium/proton antiporter [Polycyclovorans sp.]MBU0789863.1 potassium/proton antiporter [Gammaproteobacteria bacterium]MDP1543380.1 potassium/proton antiporter [Polycyclovorans sp.]|tara:strand:- start:11346 stop:13088 length:1743 start_codon:yes stop_codon:yes gene_type:complete